MIVKLNSTHIDQDLLQHPTTEIEIFKDRHYYYSIYCSMIIWFSNKSSLKSTVNIGEYLLKFWSALHLLLLVFECSSFSIYRHAPHEISTKTCSLVFSLLPFDFSTSIRLVESSIDSQKTWDKSMRPFQLRPSISWM